MAPRTDDGPVVHLGRTLSFNGDPGDWEPRGGRPPGTQARDPQASGDDAPACYEFHANGALLVAQGRIAAVGPAGTLLGGLPRDIPVVDHGRHILMPGFIDTHIHYPQTDVIAAGGRQLLDWLEDYTFVEEARFGDAGHAADVAEFFLDELTRNGTTTASVFCTVHPESVEALFSAAAARNLCLIAGKVLMDRNAPAALRDTPASAERESRILIERWHRKGRLHYAVTPRFACTSSPEQLAVAGALARDHADLYIQSHVAENHAEIAWVRELYPAARSYLDVYDGYGLLRERAIYAHCIHLDAADRRRMAASGAAAAFCPTSNLYLGSGLFDLEAADSAGMRFSTATDVGGGSSFSMLRTLDEARKVARLRGQDLTPLRAFYLATLGAARCLHLDDRIGRLAAGRDADFIALDVDATPLIARRTAAARTLSDELRVLMTLGDDRAIAATYVQGCCLHGRQGHS